MNTLILFILLQFRLFGGSVEPLTGAGISIVNESNNETVAYSLIGQTGHFEITNLDPGNYLLILKVPENTVKTVDRRTRHRFESNIEAGYNPRRSAYFWQHPDGFVKVDYKRMTRISDSIIPKHEPYISESDTISHERKPLFERLEVRQKNNYPEEKVILQFTVIRQNGRISGVVESSSQRDFFRTMVGNDDEKYEDSGKVIVLSRTEK